MFGINKDVLTAPDNVNLIDVVIGRTVLSRSTANEIGHVHDLLLDPTEGELSGLLVQLPDESLRLVDYQDVHGFGPDAVMIESDESAVDLQSSPLRGVPTVIGDLIGAKVITDTGKVLGQIAKAYIHIADRSFGSKGQSHSSNDDSRAIDDESRSMADNSFFIYEIRSSILDKLLGHSLYIPGSAGRAFSSEAMRLIVSDESAENASHTLDELSNSLFGPPRAEEPMVVVRSRGQDLFRQAVRRN
jgi:sporulation protein YlmC with PRC-barrel domain